MTAATPPPTQPPTQPPTDDLVYVPFRRAALDLIRDALLQSAATRRRASEAAAAELLAGRQPGEDIRTPSTHIVGMLGEAGALESAAATVENYAAGITSPPPPQTGPAPAAARPSRRHLRVAAPPELNPRAAANLTGEQRAAATLASLQAAPPEDLAGPPVNLADELDIDDPAPDDVVNVDLGGPVE